MTRKKTRAASAAQIKMKGKEKQKRSRQRKAILTRRKYVKKKEILISMKLAKYENFPA